MTTSIEIVCTTLPNGFAGDNLRLSVFFSPRLSVDGASLTGAPVFTTLEAFPDFSLPRLAAASFTVEAPSGAPVTARLASQPVADLWGRVFPSTFPVRSWRPSTLPARTLTSYPACDASRHIEALYRGQLAGGTTFPALSDAGIQSLLTAVRAVDAARTTGGPNSPIMHDLPPDAKAWSAAVQAAESFYAIPDPTPQYAERVPGVTPKIPDNTRAVDFHARLATFGDYPSLLRHLGIVVDLLVPRQGAVAAAPRVRVALQGAPEAWKLTRLWTLVDAASFLPRPAGSEMIPGYLQLAQAFVAYQIDVDGSILKAANWARSMNRPALAASASPPTNASLPALRTGAITIGQQGRAVAMAARLAASAALDETKFLSAEDVRRGYRLDVQYGSTVRSLCARTLTGQVAGAPYDVLPWDQEGYVKGSGGTSKSGADTDALKIHEALLSWDGWSLVAPRPGAPVGLDRLAPGAAGAAAAPADPSTEDPVVALDVAATAGSLTRLRFGRTYHLRARVVDLAGNSPPPSTEPGPTPAMSSPVTFLRYEPVPSPVVVALGAFTEGESLEHLVIRSAGGPDQPTAETFAASADGQAHGYQAQNRRFVHAPKATQIMVETHGLLDPLGREEAFWVSAREQGSLLDTWSLGAGTYRNLPPGTVAICGPGSLVTEPPRLDGPADVDIPLQLPDDLGKLSQRPDPTDPTRTLPLRGQPLEPGQLVVHRRRIPTPYLPDPMAEGAVLWSPPPALELEAGRAPYQGSWPALVPSTLTLLQGDKPALGGEPGQWTLRLPPATLITLRLSTLPVKDRLSQLAWNHELAADGMHWMVTPWREVTFVHAVLRPLAAPVPDTKAWTRPGLGATSATLAGPIQVHSHSTGHADLYARWTDRLDLLGSAGWVATDHEGHVAQIPVVYGENLPAISLRHDFGDTKHHQVDYHLVAATRYREYFAPELTADVKSVTLDGPVVTVDIPSSKNPDAPRVLYVVPTFRWIESATRKTRVGRGVRIWMDRPWYSSGDGELLGVALQRGTTAAPVDPAHPSTTEWANDPFRPGALRGNPARQHFPNAVAAGSYLIPGTSEVVDVVGFEPTFDRDDPPTGYQGRKLWFCDVEIDSGAEPWPFVRLALCRWQRSSLPTAELSTITRPDFVQLVPDRTATVSFAAGSATLLVDQAPAKLGVLGAVKEAPPLGREAEALRANAAIAALAAETAVTDLHHVTSAELQRRPVAETSDLAWTLDLEVPIAELSLLSGAVPHWRGTLHWTTLAPGYQHRIVVRQYDRVPSDPLVRALDDFPVDRELTFVVTFDVPG